MYRDNLAAAQARVGVLERELAQRLDHAREVRRLREALTRFSSARTPRDMRLLTVGMVGAMLGSLAFMVAMSALAFVAPQRIFPLEVAVFLPWFAPPLFVLLLVGLRGLVSVRFDGMAPFWLAASPLTLALAIPLLPMHEDVRRVAEATLWMLSALPLAYLIWRTPRLSRPLRFAFAATCTVSAVVQTVTAINDAFWESYVLIHPALYNEAALKLLAATLGIGSIALLCLMRVFFLVREELLQRAWEGEDSAV